MTEWGKDLVLYRMTRADEALEDARILAGAERWNACVNRLYYDCFYAVSAVLIREGLSSSKYSGSFIHAVPSPGSQRLWRIDDRTINLLRV